MRKKIRVRVDALIGNLEPESWMVPMPADLWPDKPTGNSQVQHTIANIATLFQHYGIEAHASVRTYPDDVEPYFKAAELPDRCFSTKSTSMRFRSLCIRNGLGEDHEKILSVMEAACLTAVKEAPGELPLVFSA